jgi:hypothetical protein
MTANDTTSPVHGQAGYQGGASPGQLPAVISHLTAMCRARRDRGVTADVVIQRFPDCCPGLSPAGRNVAA